VITCRVYWQGAPANVASGVLIRNQPGDYAESDTTDLPIAALALGLMLGGGFTAAPPSGICAAHGLEPHPPAGRMRHTSGVRLRSAAR